MQTFLSHETRRLTRTLENFTDSPPAIDWDQTEREAWPTVEFHHDGRQFKPGRWERAGKGPAVYIAGDILRAPASVLMPLYKEGKINLGLPHASIGRERDTDKLVIVPWFVTSANPAEPFDGTLVRVRLRKKRQCGGRNKA